MWGTSRQWDETLSAFRMSWEKVQRWNGEKSHKDTSFLCKNPPGKLAASIISTLKKKHTLRLDHKDKETVINELLPSAVWQYWNLGADGTDKNNELLLLPPPLSPGNRYQRNRIRTSFRQFQITTRVGEHQQVPLLITIYKEVKGICPKPNI